MSFKSIIVNNDCLINLFGYYDSFVATYGSFTYGYIYYVNKIYFVSNSIACKNH